MLIEIENLHKSLIIGNIYRPPRESNELITQLNDEFSKSMHHKSGERNLYIQTGLLQFSVGWPYSTGFYSPAKITERRSKMCTDETTGF